MEGCLEKSSVALALATAKASRIKVIASSGMVGSVFISEFHTAPCRMASDLAMVSHLGCPSDTVGEFANGIPSFTEVMQLNRRGGRRI